MDLVEVIPDLYMFRFEVGQAYLWRDPAGPVLIDTGPAGSAPAIAGALRSLGHGPADLRYLILTHFHEDHTGSANGIGSWGPVTVAAHRLDAPVIRGEAAAPPPDFTDAPDWESVLYESKPELPPAPPCRVDRELEDGDELDFAGGARIVGAPGHTDGSIAVHLPGPRVLFTGDAVASAEGRAMLGVFNTDRPRAMASLRRLSRLDTDVACFGHGDPVRGGASAALQTAAAHAV